MSRPQYFMLDASITPTVTECNAENDRMKYAATLRAMAQTAGPQGLVLSVPALLS